MMNYAETASIGTNISLSPVPSPSNEQETSPLPSPTGLDSFVWLCIGNIAIGVVSATLMNGYLAACNAFQEMEGTEHGAFFLLTGYEYAHLTRQYIPNNLSPIDKREWQRGFIAGWNACTFGLGTEEQTYEAE